jgi:hypothetical protein
MNSWLKDRIQIWLGIDLHKARQIMLQLMVDRMDKDLDKLNGCQFEHHMRLLELESKVAKLENARHAPKKSTKAR